MNIFQQTQTHEYYKYYFLFAKKTVLPVVYLQTATRYFE